MFTKSREEEKDVLDSSTSSNGDDDLLNLS